MRARGFTLVETLVSVVLLSVGIVGALGALSEMTKSESRIRESAQLRRLAQSKLDEVIATDEILQAPLEGDFSEQGIQGITYSIETEPATVENMLIVRSSVHFTNKADDSGVTVTALIFQQPQATGGRP